MSTPDVNLNTSANAVTLKRLKTPTAVSMAKQELKDLLGNVVRESHFQRSKLSKSILQSFVV